MANDAAGTTWNEAEPALTDPRFLGQQEIRGLRTGVRLRTQREHETFAGSSVGGEHKPGSAKAYHQASAPTLRPDGTTALDSNDAGRLWRNTTTGVLSVWTGSAWVSVNQPTTAVPVTLSAGNLTDLRSDAGWTNNSGSLILLQVTVNNTAGGGTGHFNLQYDHAGGGFLTVSISENTSSGFSTITALVANNAKARIRKDGAATPSASLFTARYQVIVI